MTKWHRPTLSERLWSKILVSDDPTICWPWGGARETSGYGILTTIAALGTRISKAHRLAYMDAIGPIPTGLQVLHHCDNRPCCNPHHLFLGTNRDNVDDKVAKGRQTRAPLGVANWRAVLTDEDVRSIRSLYAQGNVSQDALARQFGVGQTQIGRIIRREKWQHI